MGHYTTEGCAYTIIHSFYKVNCWMSALIQLTYLLCRLIEMQHIVVILTLIYVQSASKVLTQVHFHFEWYLVK